MHPPPRFVPNGRRVSGNQGVQWNRQLHGSDRRVEAFGLELHSRVIEKGFPLHLFPILLQGIFFPW